MRRGGRFGRAGLTALALGLGLALVASGLTALLSGLPGVSPGLATAGAYVVVLTVGLGYATYRVGTRRLLASLQPQRLPRERYPGLYRRFDRVAAAMDVESPHLLVADVGQPNALSLGGRRGGYVVVDPRLLGLLDADELEGVLAHELAHLRSRDSIVQSVAYSFVRTIGTAVYLLVLPAVAVVLVARRLLRSLSGQRTRPVLEELLAMQYRTLQATVVVLVALTLVTRAFSRHREYVADDRAVDVTGKPLALASALRKIDRAATTPEELLAQLSIRGDEDGTLTRLLATHPPMGERIERLRRRAERDRDAEAVEIPVR